MVTRAQQVHRRPVHAEERLARLARRRGERDEHAAVRHSPSIVDDHETTHDGEADAEHGQERQLGGQRHAVVERHLVADICHLGAQAPCALTGVADECVESRRE